MSLQQHSCIEHICQEMPKVELHAHLNGCISEEILSRVPHVNSTSQSGHLRPIEPRDVKEDIGGTIELAECFRTFAKIHDVITTPEILQWVTTQVIEDFSSDNVVYLELRTTPKIIHAIPSKDAYMQSVLQAILDCKTAGLPITVKLLVSIDRKLSPVDGIENVQIAIKWSKMYPDIVVGMDFSGDPTKGNFESFVPALHKAREHNLKISLHLLEVANIEEAKQMLNFRPERVGHAVKTHPDSGGTAELWEMLKRQSIPVEVCLTSNLVTRTVKSLEAHHLQYLEGDGLPFIICTDDSGVFRTTLSKEYTHMARLLNSTSEQIREICLKTVDHIFASEEEKVKIQATMNEWWDQKQVTVNNETFEADDICTPKKCIV